MSGSKILIVGEAGTGKTTLISKLPPKETFLISMDGKECPLEMPHVYVSPDMEEEVKLLGVAYLENLIKEKMVKFNKMNDIKQPKYVVFDSLSRAASIFTNYFGVNRSGSLKGYDRWSFTNAEVLKLMEVFDRMVSRGMNVIIVSHLAKNDKGDLEELVGKRGYKETGLIAVFNNVLTLTRNKNKRTLGIRCADEFSRTTIPSDIMPDSMDSEDFDFVKYVETIYELKNKANTFAI